MSLEQRQTNQSFLLTGKGISFPQWGKLLRRVVIKISGVGGQFAPAWSNFFRAVYPTPVISSIIGTLTGHKW
jgi:hypothetical protein